jgi:glutathione peroxidase
MRYISKLLLALMVTAALPFLPAGAADPDPYRLSLVGIDGEPLPLGQYRGKPLLVVNTASLCGFTYQYDALQTLWERYRDRGLVVLAVPSGDFGGQEYGSNAEIKEFCETRFDLDFPMTEKVHVKGPDAHPLFVWLRQELGEAAAPRWNFHKYLVDGAGRAVASWPSAVEPTAPELTGAIERVLPAG